MLKTVQASLVSEYNASRHNALLDVRQATRRLADRDSKGDLNTLLQSVLSRHSASQRFTITLLHTPFYLEGSDAPATLNTNQAMVRFGNVAMPVNVSRLPPDVQARIVPAVWGFRVGEIVPLQFAHSTDPVTDQLSSSDLALFADIQAILLEHSVSEVLGLALLAHTPSGLVYNNGKLTITLPFDLSQIVPGDERYESSWVAKARQKPAVRSILSGGGVNAQSYVDCAGYCGYCYYCSY